MANMKITNYGQDMEIVIGDGIFATETVKVAANGTVVLGDLLLRDSDGKLAAFTGAANTVPVALYAEHDDLAGGTAGASFSVRVLRAGVVKQDKIKVAGTAATAVQLDLAKNAGIVAQKVTEIMGTDNQ